LDQTQHRAQELTTSAGTGEDNGFWPVLLHPLAGESQDRCEGGCRVRCYWSATDADRAVSDKGGTREWHSCPSGIVDHPDLR